MTNMEYYKDKLLDMLCDGTPPAVSKNYKLTACNKIVCSGCLFKDSTKGCKLAFREWLEQEYDAADIDWSKVPEDTKVLVKDRRDDEWRRRYFAGYEKKAFLTYPNGSTSWSYDPKYSLTSWGEAKLADTADIEKYQIKE